MRMPTARRRRRPRRPSRPAARACAPAASATVSSGVRGDDRAAHDVGDGARAGTVGHRATSLRRSAWRGVYVTMLRTRRPRAGPRRRRSASRPRAPRPTASVAAPRSSSFASASSSAGPTARSSSGGRSRRQSCGSARELVRERDRAVGARRPARSSRLARPMRSASSPDTPRPVRIRSSACGSADEAGQPDGAAVDQRDAPAPAEHAEHRVAGGDAQVAPERELEPAGDRVALDRRDHRLVEQHARSGPSARRRRA